ncbi:UNVERIFIED_CONTAM: Serine/threonine-protein kinase VPS15 [Sesamum latifolium]|uniref:Serine/threonine-protein kinase VPS15 n=1 Tax=Sesamum latifolium TaxID=2727402 RepID=A0AAW2VF73_9LAMI
MGNKIARTTQASATEYYLHDLPSSYNLVLKEVLGRDRFLKSILCKHDEELDMVGRNSWEESSMNFGCHVYD